ncbi:S41 family peptidase [Flavobacterium sp.]|jgi:C-terminal processing protease CtpA/Prc|uniref:S41 family peptidase n=1 Tax=Flavobacterium sp. TaxID=239 RepID=UPI0037BF0B3A
MKKILLFIFVFSSLITFSQTKVPESQKIERLIQIWGLLKYHHPEISKGKLNWNQEFITLYDKIEKIETNEQLNQELLSWITGFESESTKKLYKKKVYDQQKLFTKNYDYSWIETSNFNPILISKLHQIRENSNYGDFYASIDKLNNFINFKNDKGFDSFNYRIKSHRILFLASFWNVMKYWNVNIYLTDEPWSEVLKNLQLDFINADTEEKFEFAKMKLFSKLNDSHSDYFNDYIFKNVYNRFASFGGKLVNDSLVVTTLHSKSLAGKDNIKLKDVIYEIESKSVKDYFYEKFKDFGSTSNLNNARNIYSYYWLLSSNKDSMHVKFISADKKIESKYVKLYEYETYKPEEKENISIPKQETFYELNTDIGFINLGKISKKELKTAFYSFANKKGIIIDLRNYPTKVNEDDIAKYLYPKKKIFVKILAPSKPSLGNYDMQAPLKFLKNPFAAGSKNRKYFKGKIVLMVNRSTGSRAEYFAMLIQQSPNCTAIGEQTFGAIMNRIEITLSDKTTIDFTGMGAFYPNDIGVQRNGIKIDYEVKESAKNYNPNQYIEEAIKIINQ